MDADDTVTAKLAQWTALTEGAAEGPWEAVSSEVTMNDRSEWRIGDRSRPQVLRAQMRSADAEFIAAARTAMPALIAAVKDVLAIHYQGPDYCAECVRFAPCPTVQALTKWLGGEG